MSALFSRKWREAGRPSETAGNLTLGLGLASLLPLVAPFAAVLASAIGGWGMAMGRRRPEKHGGRRKILAGLGLCVVGLLLFFVEGALFLRAKTRQAYEQRTAISRLRMTEIQQAMERFREENGEYPEAKGIMSLSRLLQPKYVPLCPVLDGFDQAYSVTSWREGYVLSCNPPAAPDTPDHLPDPVVVKSSFHPAPKQPPDFIGPPAPPGLSLQEAPGQEAPAPAGPPVTPSPGLPPPAPQPGAP